MYRLVQQKQEQQQQQEEEQEQEEREEQDVHVGSVAKKYPDLKVFEAPSDYAPIRECDTDCRMH